MDLVSLSKLILENTDICIILDKLPKTKDSIKMIIDISRNELFYSNVDKLSLLNSLYNDLDPQKYFNIKTLKDIRSEFSDKIQKATCQPSPLHYNYEYEFKKRLEHKELFFKQNEELKVSNDILQKINKKQENSIEKLKALYEKSLNSFTEEKEQKDKLETHYQSKIIEFKDDRKKRMKRKNEDKDIIKSLENENKEIRKSLSKNKEIIKSLENKNKEIRKSLSKNKEIIKSLSKNKEIQCKNIKTLKSQNENLQLKLKDKEEKITYHITLNKDKDSIIEDMNEELKIKDIEILKLIKQNELFNRTKFYLKKKDRFINQLKFQIKKQKECVKFKDKLSKEKQTEINTLREKYLENETENKITCDKLLLFQNISKNLKNSLLEYEREGEIIGYRWGEQWMDPLLYDGVVY